MVNKLISDLDVGTPATNTEIEILLNAAAISTRSDLSVVLALYDALVSTMTNKSIDQDGTGNSITNIANASVKAAAAIAVNKLAALTVSKDVTSDTSGFLTTKTRILQATKPADESKTTDTTLANDDTLIIAVLSGGE